MALRQADGVKGGIRDDHLNRYKFAIDEARSRGLSGRDFVLDAGCGTGYGSHMMAEAGMVVRAFDADQKSIDIANQQYVHRQLSFMLGDFSWYKASNFDLIVMFEALEHSPEALKFLKRVAPNNRMLMGSVPNETIVPFDSPRTHPEHYRHFTSSELVHALYDCGWVVSALYGQKGKKGPGADIIKDIDDARTLVFVAESKEWNDANRIH